MRLQERLLEAANNNKKRAKKQPKLKDLLKVNDTTAADFAVGQWAFAHDIPSNVLSGIYWKQVNSKLSQVFIFIIICIHFVICMHCIICMHFIICMYFIICMCVCILLFTCILLFVCILFR